MMRMTRRRKSRYKSGEGGALAAVVWKTYIDQYAGRFNYLKVISGSMLPDTEVYNASKKHKERISKLYTMIGSKQEDMPKINAGDIGVVVKLDKTATCDTLCDAKKAVVLSTHQAAATRSFRTPSRSSTRPRWTRWGSFSTRSRRKTRP